MTDRIYTGTATVLNAGGLTQEEMYALKDRVTQLEYGGLPVGSVIPYVGVTYTAAANGGTKGYINGSTIASVKAAVLASTNGKWTVCDGTIISDADSAWNSKYVPDLTANRFLRGSITVGDAVDQPGVTLTNAMLPSHEHLPGSHVVAASGFTFSGGTVPSLTGTAVSSGTATVANKDHYHTMPYGWDAGNEFGLHVSTVDVNPGYGSVVRSGARMTRAVSTWTGYAVTSARLALTDTDNATSTIGITGGAIATFTGSSAVTGNSGNPTVAQSTVVPIIPQYLSCFFLIRVK